MMPTPRRVAFTLLLVPVAALWLVSILAVISFAYAIFRTFLFPYTEQELVQTVLWESEDRDVYVLFFLLSFVALCIFSWVLKKTVYLLRLRAGSHSNTVALV
ncbi:glucan phosphoethanolaminetransferase (alkaline phosphatase superfamily) [Hymenobacter sp. UYP22]